MTTPDDALDDSAAPGPRRSPGYVLAVTLAVLFAMAAVGMGLVAASSRDSEKGDREEAFALAGRFTETLFSYDYRDPESSRDRVLDMATGSFRDEYEQDFRDLFGAKIAESQLRLRAKVDDLYLSQIDEGTASALVVVDIESSSKGGPPQLFGNLYLRLTMLKIEGDWKVDSVEYNVLSDTRIIAGDTGTGGSTSTTVPASPTTSVP